MRRSAFRLKPPRELQRRVSKQMFWRVEEEWRGHTAAILGGGPSLSLGGCEAARAAGCKAIAVNNAYLLAAWADILYFADRHWWEWNHNEPGYRRFAGRKVTLENKRISFGQDGKPAEEPGVLALCNYGKDPVGLCFHRDGVHTGSNSGFQAMNLAVHLGVKRILLLGFDMRIVGRRLQWHDLHQRPTPADVYENHMIPAFEAAVNDLKAAGVEVVNCTPGSALKCFPVMTVEEALCVSKT